MATLLETLQSLKEDELDAWLESLTIEEKMDLWAQCIAAMVDEVLPQMVRLFGGP